MQIMENAIPRKKKKKSLRVKAKLSWKSYLFKYWFEENVCRKKHTLYIYLTYYWLFKCMLKLCHHFSIFIDFVIYRCAFCSAHLWSATSVSYRSLNRNVINVIIIAQAFYSEWQRIDSVHATKVFSRGTTRDEIGTWQGNRHLCMWCTIERDRVGKYRFVVKYNQSRPCYLRDFSATARISYEIGVTHF